MMRILHRASVCFSWEPSAQAPESVACPARAFCLMPLRAHAARSLLRPSQLAVLSNPPPLQYAYMGRPQSFWDWFFRDFGKPGATSELRAQRLCSSSWQGAEHVMRGPVRWLPLEWTSCFRPLPSRTP